jgi:hypothetical protein
MHNRAMTRDEFIDAHLALEMTAPDMARFLNVAERTVRGWRANPSSKTCRKIPGPVIKCLELEFEKRGLPWIL